MCMLVRTRCPQKSEEGTGFPGTGVAVSCSCKQPHRCERSKAGPPQEQPVRLPLESSLQLQSENLNMRSQKTDSEEKLRNK